MYCKTTITISNSKTLTIDPMTESLYLRTQYIPISMYIIIVNKLLSP